MPSAEFMALIPITGIGEVTVGTDLGRLIDAAVHGMATAFGEREQDR